MDVTKNTDMDVVEAADIAMGRIERTAHIAGQYWPVVIAGLYELRKRAMRSARTDDIGSGRYRAEFSRLRGQHKHLAKLNPNEASACCWAGENPDLYELAKAGMMLHHGQAPTPHGVFQRAQRLAKAKLAAAAKANQKEQRTAERAAAGEWEQAADETAEDRDRIAVLGHERVQLLERRIEALEVELAKVTAERDALLAAQVHGIEPEEPVTVEEPVDIVTPATVAQALRAVVDERHGGNVSAAARALGYAGAGPLRKILVQGDRLSAATALKCQQRIEALDTPAP